MQFPWHDFHSFEILSFLHSQINPHLATALILCKKCPSQKKHRLNLLYSGANTFLARQALSLTISSPPRSYSIYSLALSPRTYLSSNELPTSPTQIILSLLFSASSRNQVHYLTYLFFLESTAKVFITLVSRNIILWLFQVEPIALSGSTPNFCQNSQKYLPLLTSYL